MTASALIAKPSRSLSDLLRTAALVLGASAASMRVRSCAAARITSRVARIASAGAPGRSCR